MKKYVKVNIVLAVVGLIISIFIGIVIESFLQSGYQAVEIKFGYLMGIRCWQTIGLTYAVFMLCLISSFNGGMLSRVGQSKLIDVGLENSHFMTKKEVAENYKKVSLEELPSTNSGIVVGADEKGKKLDVLFADPIHTLVIGNTGSGKTQTYISPTIEILGRCKDKPSMIISDPKGELFARHSQPLSELGYSIQLIDLIQPLNSTRWNPLTPIYERYQRMLKTNNKKKRLEILDEVYDDIRELVLSLFKVDENAKDKIWDSGMQRFLQAILIAMLEDSENKSSVMTKDKFNFAAVRMMSANTQNDCAELKEYFYNRPKTSEARIRVSQVLDTTDRTLQSYFTVIADAMAMFSDVSICSMTSNNKVNVRTFDDVPTALFLKIPDERVGRYDIASAFFSITYKELVGKARGNQGSVLSRPVYFIIDEFGNLPQLNKLDNMLAVARSRKIFFVLVVQSYDQIEKIYGKTTAESIKANCNIEVFIGSKELGTLEAFSKKCGNYTVTSSSVSSNRVGDYTGNMSTKERPVIYPSQLSKLNNPPKSMGNTIVLMSGKLPLFSKFTPIFKSKIFVAGEYAIKRASGKVFDVSDNYYDISGNQGFEIPEEFDESQEVQQVKKKEKYISNTVIKFVSLYEIERAEIIEKLFAQEDYKSLLDIIALAMDKAEDEGKTHIVTALSSEFVTIKRLLKETIKDE